MYQNFTDIFYEKIFDPKIQMASQRTLNSLRSWKNFKKKKKEKKEDKRKNTTTGGSLTLWFHNFYKTTIIKSVPEENTKTGTSTNRIEKKPSK